MTGILNQLLGSGGGTVVSPLGITANANGAAVSATVNFLNDGTLSFVSTGGSNSAQPGWFTPPTTSVGSQYWINFSITSGVFSATPGTAGTWISLSATATFRNTAAAGSTRVGQASFSIASDAAGANVVGTGTVNCSTN